MTAVLNKVGPLNQREVNQHFTLLIIHQDKLQLTLIDPSRNTVGTGKVYLYTRLAT